MRASLITDRIEVAPGVAATALVEVTNTLGVIDGVSVSAASGAGLEWSAAPALLPLFPGSSGRLALTFTAGPHLPAGAHRVTLEVRSSVDSAERATLTLTLDVLRAPSASMAVDPPARRARHRARYQLVLANLGNTVLDLDLAAADPARILSAKVSPPSLTVPPGEEARAELTVEGRRHLLGAERRQRVAVQARAEQVEIDAFASFRQAPLVPTGARTAAVLGVIVAMWAAVFLVALSRANSSDPLTKEVPPSFYASVASQRVNTAAFGALSRGGLLASAASPSTPAGAVPKSGVVIGVGGTVNGTVDAASTGAGVGRITVQAVRDSPNGPVLVSSAATASDGTYSLVGLMPGDYKLEFSAPGYRTVWYPDAPDETSAAPVVVAALADTNGIDATITGLPGSISGTVYTGETPSPPVTVTVVAEQGNGQTIATVTTNSSGNYTIASLPAPGTYDLSFTAPGYQVASDTEEIAAGEAHIANSVTLSAGPGTLGGVVTDGSKPLGGVTITANANGQTITSATPTTGEIGHFSIPNLTTPATYLLTFSDPGYGSVTVAEHLGPGQSLTDLTIPLSGGAGQISGEVTSQSGAPLGGVSVTVDNLAAPVSTETLTAGSVGSFLLSGLATPGDYTLTFSLAGYQPQTLEVTLTSSGSASGVQVQLPPEAAALTGTVTSASGNPLTGVTVTATNGSVTRTTTTTSSPPGGYSLGSLAPESYSVTFSLSGYQSETVLVHLQPGQTANASASLTPNPPA